MIILEFKLTMPGRGSWDGRWTGEARNYVRVRSIRNANAKTIQECLNEDGIGYFHYSWSDGWAAGVSVRILDAQEAKRVRSKKSDGFCGYDWMIDSIIKYGAIYADHEKPAEGDR